MNDTIDTLKIKVEGDGDSAVKTLDSLLSTLERIKGSTTGRGISTLTSKLDSLKNTINSIKTKNLSKLTAMFSTLSSIQRVNIPPSLATRITGLGDAVRSLDGVDFSQLNAMASGLSALSSVGNVRIPRVTGGTPEAGADTSAYEGEREVIPRTVSVSNADVARVTTFSERAREAYHNVQGWARSVQESNKWFDKIGRAMSPITSRLKAIKTNVREAFSDTIVGRFAAKIKETFTSLGRIALYRVMRTLIKQVTEAFKTGIDDMYQYSKTFNGNYAQSMDQLASANLSFKNSIGAIMAPLIELVTPWLDSFVDKLIEINNTIAMVLAGLAGKKTYSKAVRVTTEYAEAADKAADNTSKVKDKVEELKRSLAGLDEITIIGNNLSPISSAAGGEDNVSKGLDYGSMFVEAPVDMDKVDEIKTKLQKILEIAKWIGIAFAAWNLAKFIGSISEALLGVSSLKQAIGLTLMITGFSLEWSGGYHMGYGDAGAWDYIKAAVGAALGVAGSLLVFGTGPVGWAIGITAAITIFIASVNVGATQRLSDLIEEAFYNSGGSITISDLAGQFERYCRALINSLQPTIDLGREIDNLRENSIIPTITKIEGIGLAIAYSAKITPEELEKIKKEFEKLYNDSSTTLEKMHDLIIQSLAGGFGETLTALGYDIPEITKLITGTSSDMKRALDDLEVRQSKLTAQLEAGTITREQYNAKIVESLKEIEKLTGVTDPATESMKKLKDTVKGVDWEDQTQRDNALTQIKQAAQDARTAIDETYHSIKSTLETYRENAKTEDQKLIYTELITGTDAYREQMLNEVSSQLDDLYSTIHNDIVSRTSNLAQEIADSIDDADLWSKMTQSQESYVANGLTEYKNKVVTPIEEGIKEAYSELGKTGQVYAGQALQTIIEGMFTYDSWELLMSSGLTYAARIGTAGGYTRLNTHYTGKGVTELIKENGLLIGQALPEGIVKGIDDSADKANKAVSKLGKDIIDDLKESTGVNSPSKYTKQIMEYCLEGLALPLKNEQNTVLNPLDRFMNTMLARFEAFGNRWRSAVNTLFDDLAYGWQNADFRSDGSYSYKYLSMKSIQRFAQGGFPEDGLFYANHNEIVGQFSNGRTAVANNEQIVEGIAGGVAAANEDQNALLREQNRLLRMLLDKESTIDVSTITNAFDRQNKRNGRPTVAVS